MNNYNCNAILDIFVQQNSCLQAFYQKANICKYTHNQLFKLFLLNVLTLIQQFLEDRVDYSLFILEASDAKIFPHYFKVNNINNIIEDIIANTFFNNLSSYFNNYTIFFCFLLPYYYQIIFGAYFDKILNVFPKKYGLRQI